MSENPVPIDKLLLPVSDLPDITLTKPDEDEDDELDEPEAIEAYCVKCKDKVEMESPQAVWTSRGQPATRGLCPDCGTVVFRIGKTDAHRSMVAPPPVRVEDTQKLIANKGKKKMVPATFINAGALDAEFGAQLAKELDQAGVHTWFEADVPTENTVQWAGGAHPALRDCVKMVVILSEKSKDSETVKNAWAFFKKDKKPIVVALIDPVEVPDALRRNPRFDFSKDYKSALRQMMQALSDMG